MSMTVNGQEATFDVFKATRLPAHYEELKMISVVEPELTNAELDHFLASRDPLETALVYGEDLKIDAEVEECLSILDTSCAYLRAKKDVKFVFNEACLTAFDDLKRRSVDQKVCSRGRGLSDSREVTNHPMKDIMLVTEQLQRLKIFGGKLKSKWSGPFEVVRVTAYGAVELKRPNSDETFLVNGQRVKHYYGEATDRARTTIDLEEA
ncbi:uncharacterized protein LOC132610269 [Lycium barbarum]|uniref:uncharacterized protein LOC132610269 n=1 Tax=Lycium barbarum TaxID=112863 RepID=UPI00293F5852|nr:uncharacterized protein LOC132610269 [Lycium barbarum]